MGMAIHVLGTTRDLSVHLLRTIPSSLPIQPEFGAHMHSILELCLKPDRPANQPGT